MVEIKDKSVKIGIQDNFGMLISNQSGPTLVFAQEGNNLQLKMADIEIFKLRYNPNIECQRTHFYETNDMFIIMKIIYDIGKSFQIQDGCQISRF